MKVTFFNGTTSVAVSTAPQVVAVAAAIPAIEAAAQVAVAGLAPGIADAIRAQVATDADRAETAAGTIEEAKGKLDTLGDPKAAGTEGESLIEYQDGRRILVNLPDGIDAVPSARFRSRLGFATAPADGWAATEDGALVTFSADAGLGRVDRFREPSGIRIPTARRALVLVHYGQSNSGVRAMAEPMVWASAPTPWHVLTLNDRNGTTVPGNLGGMEGWGGATPNVTATAVVPAVEYDQQTIVGAAASRLVDLWADPLPPAVICGTAGHGGQAFYGTGAANTGLHLISEPARDGSGNIDPATKPAFSRAFTNFVARIRDMVTLGRTADFAVDRVYVPFTHQEAESQLSRADYLRRWLDFKADAEAQIAAAVSDVQVTWLVDQGGGTTSAATGNAWQPRMSIYDATLPENDGANVVMVQPRYWLPLGMDVNNPTQPDSIHHSYSARILQGEVTAYCVRELEAGRPWRCAWPVAVTVSGSVITVDFDSLTPLTLDRSYIPIRPDLGFEMRDTAATITSVMQADARRIVIECSASPAGGFLRYAYHNSAGEPWTGYTVGTGALRETWAAESRFLSGQMLYRPALGFEWGL